MPKSQPCTRLGEAPETAFPLGVTGMGPSATRPCRTLQTFNDPTEVSLTPWAPQSVMPTGWFPESARVGD